MENKKWTVHTLKEELKKRGVSIKGARVKQDFLDLLNADDNANAGPADQATATANKLQSADRTVAGQVTDQTESKESAHGLLGQVIELEKVRLDKAKEDNRQRRFYVKVLSVAVFIWFFFKYWFEEMKEQKLLN